MSPVTDFEQIFPKDGDLPSELDVFNQDNKERQMREKIESVKNELNRIKREREEKAANERKVGNSAEIEIED